MFKKENLATTSFILILALLIGFAVFSSFTKESAPILKTTTDMTFELDKQPVLGDPDAPVSMMVFYDYNCPHCQVWESEILPILESDIVRSGSVNLRFINYQFMSANSTYAGMASEMVHEHAPEQFLAFNKALFDNQLAINMDYLAEKVHEFVPSLTEDKVKEELTNQTYMDHVLSDKQYGVDLGVSSTPSLFVGDVRVENPGDFAEIETKVNAALEKVAGDVTDKDSTKSGDAK